MVSVVVAVAGERTVAVAVAVVGDIVVVERLDD